MMWTTNDDGWRKRFAVLPITITEDQPKRPKRTLWLGWYWARFCGEYTEVSFTDPRAAQALATLKGER